MARFPAPVTCIALVAGSVCLGGDQADKPAYRMTAPQHFEAHAAWMLQRMTQAALRLDPEKARAIDLVFADYYRRTAEQLPRPVLIAYPIAMTTEMSEADAQVISASKGQHIRGEIQRRADGSPVMLVENILEALDPGQEPAFREVLARWANIKPAPVSLPMIELMRATKDPLLKLTSQQEAKIEQILRKSKDAIQPVPAGAASQSDPRYERVYNEITGLLSPPQRDQLEATLRFLEQEISDWRDLKTGGDALYQQSLALLGKTPPKKRASDE